MQLVLSFMLFKKNFGEKSTVSILSLLKISNPKSIDGKINKEFYEIFHTDNVVKSTDSPLEGAKRGKDTSMWLAIESVKNKDADIVIWSGNPLSIYSQVEQTYVDGKLLFDKTQNQTQKRVLNKLRSEIISEMLIAKSKGQPLAPLKKQNNVVHKCNQTIEIDN